VASGGAACFSVAKAENTPFFRPLISQCWQYWQYWQIDGPREKGP
jgi:hypothetical protein